MTSIVIVDPLPPGEWARHPASLAEDAYRDGWTQRLGGAPGHFPRQLNRGELTAWTRGHQAARRSTACVRRVGESLRPPAATTTPPLHTPLHTAPAQAPAQAPAGEERAALLVDLLELAPPPPPTAPTFDGTQVCAQIDPELFFPEKGGSTRAAKGLCGTCEFQVPCLRYALGERIFGMPIAGIWGGTSVQERRQLLSAAAAGVLDLADVVPADVDLLGIRLDEDLAS